MLMDLKKEYLYFKIINVEFTQTKLYSLQGT